MNYSLSSLTSASDCDKLLQTANLDRSNLASRQATLTKQCNAIGPLSQKLVTDIADATSELNNLNGYLPTLTPGSDSQENGAARQKRLELNLVLLNQKVDDYNTIVLVGKQRALNETEARLAEVDAFLVLLNARIAEFNI